MTSAVSSTSHEQDFNISLFQVKLDQPTQLTSTLDITAVVKRCRDHHAKALPGISQEFTTSYLRHKYTEIFAMKMLYVNRTGHGGSCNSSGEGGASLQNLPVSVVSVMWFREHLFYILHMVPM